MTKAMDQSVVKGKEVEEKEMKDEEGKEDKEVTKPKKPKLQMMFYVRDDEDDITPYVALGSQFQQDYDRCVDLDEIVLPAETITNDTDENKCVTLWLDFPLEEGYSFKIYPEDPSKGFTRGDFLTTIKSTYDKVYAEEEERSSLGNYGVWRLSLDDIFLHTIFYDYEKNDMRLFIEC